MFEVLLMAKEKNSRQLAVHSICPPIHKKDLTKAFGEQIQEAFFHIDDKHLEISMHGYKDMGYIMWLSKAWKELQGTPHYHAVAEIIDMWDLGFEEFLIHKEHISYYKDFSALCRKLGRGTLINYEDVLITSFGIFYRNAFDCEV